MARGQAVLVHAASAALLLLLGCSHPIDENVLDRHRNLGKAFYENPTTKQEAVDEFRQARAIAPDSARENLNYALALLKAEGHEQEAVQLLVEVQRKDPALPHTWFNLGIYYKRRGDANKAIAQFEGMLARTPNEAIAHYQLGTLYRQVNRNADAQKQFETAAALDPQLAAARFQLYNLYRLAGNAEQAKTYLAEFQRLQTLRIRHVHPAELAPPEVIARLREAVLAAQLFHRHTLIRFPQEPDDLLLYGRLPFC